MLKFLMSLINRWRALAPNLQGLIYFWLGCYDKATVAFQHAIVLDPKRASLRAILGSTYLEKNCYDEAIATYQQAIRLRPGKASYYHNLGLAYSRQRHYDKAIVSYQRAIELDPKDVFLYLGLGFIYIQQGHYNEAIAAYHKTLELDSEVDISYFAYYGLGIVYSNQDQFDKAIAALRQAIEIDAKDANLHNLLGIAYHNQGSYGEAINAYKQAITLDPNLGTPYLNLGIAYSRQSQFDEAIAFYEEAQTLAHQQNQTELEAEVWFRLGLVFLRRSETEDKQQVTYLTKATYAFEQALDFANNMETESLYLARLRYYLGWCYHQQGFLQAAVESLIFARQTFTEHRARPELARVLLEMGQLYHQLHEFENAYAHLKDALRLFRRLDDQLGQATTQESLGNLLLQVGRLREAVELLKNARQGYLTLNQHERIPEVDELLEIAEQSQQQLAAEGLAA